MGFDGFINAENFENSLKNFFINTKFIYYFNQSLIHIKLGRGSRNEVTLIEDSIF